MASRRGSGDKRSGERGRSVARVAAAGAVGWIPGVGSAASQAAVEVVDHWQRRREARGGYVLDTASKIGNLSLQQLVDRLTDGPVKENLAAQLLEAAGRTASRRKLVAIGRQLHKLSGLADDEQLNREVVEGATLAVLEEPHVAVLDYLDLDDGDTPGRTTEQIEAGRPELRRVLTPVLSVLRLHGLIADRGAPAGGSAPTWILTYYGRYFLRLFAAAADTADTGEEGMGVDG